MTTTLSPLRQLGFDPVELVQRMKAKGIAKMAGTCVGLSKSELARNRAMKARRDAERKAIGLMPWQK